MFFKKRERQYGEPVALDKNDLPPESLIKKYPFLAEIKDNPLVYMRNAGYFNNSAAGAQNSVSDFIISPVYFYFNLLILFLLITLIITSIFTRSIKGFIVPIIIFTNQIISFAVKISKRKNNTKKDSSVKVFIGISLHSQQIIDFFCFSDKQKCLDICTSCITSRDFVYSEISSSISKTNSIMIRILISLFIFSGLFLFYFPNLISMLLFIFGMIGWIQILIEAEDFILRFKIRSIKRKVDDIENVLKKGKFDGRLKSIFSMIILILVVSGLIPAGIWFYSEILKMKQDASLKSTMAIFYLINGYIFTIASFIVYWIIFSVRDVLNPEAEIESLVPRVDKIMKYAVCLLMEDDDGKFQQQ